MSKRRIFMQLFAPGNLASVFDRFIRCSGFLDFLHLKKCLSNSRNGLIYLRCNPNRSNGSTEETPQDPYGKNQETRKNPPDVPAPEDPELILTKREKDLICFLLKTCKANGTNGIILLRCSSNCSNGSTEETPQDARGQNLEDNAIRPNLPDVPAPEDPQPIPENLQAILTKREKDYLLLHLKRYNVNISNGFILLHFMNESTEKTPQDPRGQNLPDPKRDDSIWKFLLKLGACCIIAVFLSKGMDPNPIYWIKAQRPLQVLTAVLEASEKWNSSIGRKMDLTRPPRPLRVPTPKELEQLKIAERQKENEEDREKKEDQKDLTKEEKKEDE